MEAAEKNFFIDADIDEGEECEQHPGPKGEGQGFSLHGFRNVDRDDVDQRMEKFQAMLAF